MKLRSVLFGILCAVAGLSAARAETAVVTVAQQYGPSFTPLMFMEKFKLIEANAVRLGLPEPEVRWVKLAGPSMMNDGLISGALSFASTGVPALALLWDKTKGGAKGLGMISSYALYLNSRNPAVKTMADFSEKDRIAVASVKISLQAIRTQMAAEKLYGPQNYTKFDPLTVTLSHPDAMTAILNGQSEINAHYAPSPFHEREIADPRIHTVTEVRTAVFLTGTQRFRAENPLTARATFDALKQAIDMVNADKARAVAVYKEMSGDTTASADLEKQMFDPKTVFSLTPDSVEEVAQFMNRIGTIKTKVGILAGPVLPEVHGLPGT